MIPSSQKWRNTYENIRGNKHAKLLSDTQTMVSSVDLYNPHLDLLPDPKKYQGRPRISNQNVSGASVNSTSPGIKQHEIEWWK